MPSHVYLMFTSVYLYPVKNQFFWLRQRNIDIVGKTVIMVDMGYTTEQKARRQHISKLIEKVFDEETYYLDGGGRMDRCTMEEAMVRVAMKRALDPRSKLGLESTRFMTEYVYGKAIQPVMAVAGLDEAYEDLSEEELLEKQSKLLQGALHGSFARGEKDPSRVLEEGDRAAVIQGVLDAGRANPVGNEQALRWKREKEEEETNSVFETPDSNPAGTDDLLRSKWG